MKKHVGKWEGIMLHHTATSKDMSVFEIRKIHINKGWADIGYHYLLKNINGKFFIKNGRSTYYCGAHCHVGDYNSKYIGVAIIGNYSVDKFNEYEALGAALKHIMKKHSVSKILGHREVKPTQCPGNNIDMNKLRKVACLN